jgi:hypothetical protein
VTTEWSPALTDHMARETEMARPERFELPTARFVAEYSIQLSYGRIVWFAVFLKIGGERGIRTLEGLLTLTPLAGERFRPLSHLSGWSTLCPADGGRT